jgi:uncharacterized membrane protein
MKSNILSYVITLVVFTGIDFVWLSRMGNSVYRPILGDMALDTFRPVPALAFYLIYAFGVVAFAVHPALASGQWKIALINGALLGFCAYATYDLTNQATLKNWSTFLSLIDTGWGCLLTGVSATIAFFIVSLLMRSA